MYLKKPAVIGLCVAFTFAGCAHNRPPDRVVKAIHTVNLYAPEYVCESNKVLEQAKHPDAERLRGIGERLADALDALDRWVAKQEAADESR
mgnify:CR=1 FL=1